MRINAIFCLFCFTVLTSCNGTNDKKPISVINNIGNVKKEVSKKIKTTTENKKPPIINIVDTVIPKRMVIFFKDSAASMERIGPKLARIYGVKLNECFKRNTLKSTGQPMAWFLTYKAPYFFEAGIPVNMKPVKLPAGAKLKILGADSAVIAHFYGPYDLVPMGYNTLDEWLTDHHKKRSGVPFEIYITDPVDKKGKLLDPYKVQTDIVMPRH